MALVNPIGLIPPQYKILAYVLIVAAIFGAGSYTGYKFTANHYEAVISKMKEEAATLRAEKAELQTKLTAEIANVKEVIVTKYVDRIKIVKEKEYVYRDQAINNVPDRTVLSNGWVYLHDASATGDTDADPTRSADATPSGVEANQALATVAENYGACNANSEQLKSLQDFVREAQKAVEKANEIIKNQRK
jgi:hypothetical protein